MVVADLAFGPYQALSHRRLGNEEGAGDLRRRQPSEQAQGQRHLGLGGQGGMAAQEDQPELVVGYDIEVTQISGHRRLGIGEAVGGEMPLGARRLAA